MRTDSAVILTAAITAVLFAGIGVGLTAYTYETLVVPQNDDQLEESYRVIGALLAANEACHSALQREQDRGNDFLKAGDEQLQAVDDFFTAGGYAAGDVGYLYDQFYVIGEKVIRAAERTEIEKRDIEDCYADPF